MLETLITSIFCFLVIAAAIIVISLEYYYTKTKVSAVSSLPWMRRAVVKVMRDMLHNHRSDSSLKIYELGSGWGPLAIDAARAFPKAKVVGLEFSPIPLWFSILRGKLFGHKHLSFKKADFFEEDLRDADVIVLYMLESILEKLAPKFKEELKPGAIIISNTFEIKDWKPIHVETVMEKVIKLNVYVYQVPKSVPA